MKEGAKNDSKFQNLSLRGRGRGRMSPIATGFLLGEGQVVKSRVAEFNFRPI